MRRKESFWKRHVYIAAWISLAGLIIVIRELYFLKFLLTGNPTIFFTSTGCNMTLLSGFNEFLQSKCNELSVSETYYLPKKIISDFVRVENGEVEAKINKVDLDKCTSYFRCLYRKEVRENITLGISLTVCVTRSSTNETFCYSS